MLFDQIVTSTRQIPGVTGAAATSAMPLAHLDLMPVVFEHGELSAPENRLTLFANVVTEGFFQTMDIPVVAGRTFTRNDTADTPAVAVVNQAMARHFWPGRSAVGQRVRLFDEQGPRAEVVGVVGTTTYLYPSEKPQDMLYLTFRQQPRGDMTVLAQTAGRSATPLPAMQRIVHSLDASVPVYDVHTIEAFYRGHATGLGAVIMTMIASIGLMGLTITLVGLYGLVSYAVNRRTREIGIRIAIGATYSRILRMLLRQGLAPAWVGMGIGVVLSLLSSRLLVIVIESSAVFSPLVVAAILPVLAAVTLLAAFVPARRAAKTDPTVALRAE